jgi:hypothetical protein
MRTMRHIAGVVLLGLGAWTALAAQETAAQYQGADAEHFLTDARVVSVKGEGSGITLPKKVTLELDGVTRFAIFKSIDERKVGIEGDINFQDSYKTEIAAYHVDRIIGLGMVPATVQRRVEGPVGSLQWFVESMMPESQRIKQGLQPPDPEQWERQLLKMRLFDELICNMDRHADNVLITKDFQLRLIDHSRSFRPNRSLRNPKTLTRFSQSLLEGLGRLNQADLKQRVGDWLDSGQIRGLLSRRDAIVKLANEAVKAHGQAAVIYP